MNLLINLPPDFFTQPELQDRWADLESRFTVRKTSHNTPEEIEADLTWAEVVLMWSWPVLDEDLLSKTGSLKYAGHIDINQNWRPLRTRGRHSGFNLPCRVLPAVAEMALGLILNTLRKISDYHAAMRAGTEEWVQAFPVDIDPVERQLTGMTVGIVGLGQVGRRLAHFLKAFEVNLKVVDPYVADSVLASFDAERMDLDPMIEACDVVVLCAASNQGTDRLINGDRCARFRKDAILINVARAALVDTNAVAARLKQGDFFACLDVFDTEPLPADSELRTLPNAYLTPTAPADSSNPSNATSTGSSRTWITSSRRPPEIPCRRSHDPRA